MTVRWTYLHVFTGVDLIGNAMMAGPTTRLNAMLMDRRIKGFILANANGHPQFNPRRFIREGNQDGGQHPSMQ